MPTRRPIAPVAGTAWSKNTWPKPSTSSASRTAPILISPGRVLGIHVLLLRRRKLAGGPRARPAVAIGHKTANPDSIVIAYQGDGDLASIGLAEIVSTAQLGIPMTIIFVNNAVFGMTGGQMAPTTLMGQRTTTTPRGRRPLTGQPLKMAELVIRPGRAGLRRTGCPVRQPATDPCQAFH